MIIKRHIFIDDYESKEVHSVDMSSNGKYFDVNINLVINGEFETAATFEINSMEDAVRYGKKLAEKYNVPYSEYYGD